MEWLIGIAAAAVVVWFLFFRKSGAPPLLQPPRESRLDPRTETIDLRLPKLDIEPDIVAALRDGKDPNEAMTIPHHAHHLSVVGESFDNNDGTSRQQIIASTAPGTMAFLVPEPDNPHDPQAVRVFVSEGGSATAQIGYLPGGDADGILDEIRRGHVMAWFVSKRRKDKGLWGAVLFVVRTEPG